MTTSKILIILERGGHGSTSWRTCMDKKGRRVKRSSRMAKQEELGVLGAPQITQHTHTNTYTCRIPYFFCVVSENPTVCVVKRRGKKLALT